jgi:hypothetical protein
MSRRPTASHRPAATLKAGSGVSPDGYPPPTNRIRRYEFARIAAIIAAHGVIEQTTVLSHASAFYDKVRAA